jgi:hypothetical protein
LWQFAETAKKSASNLLKAVGINRKPIHPMLNRAFASFFRSLDAWLGESDGFSGRHLGEPEPSLGLLENSVEQCSKRFSGLQIESHKWKHVSVADVEDEVLRKDCVKPPNISPVRTRPASFDCFEQLFDLCDGISLETQRFNSKWAEVKTIGEQIDEDLHRKIEVNYRTQMQISDLLRRVLSEKSIVA